MENGLKISELTDGGALRVDDELVVRRGAVNRKIKGSRVGERIWRPEIFALTGGGPTTLDNVVTVGLPNRSRVDVYVDGQLQVWLLIDTSATADGVSIVIPVDWQVSNPRQWVRVL